MRVVLDSNVLIASALARTGLCAEVMRGCLANKCLYSCEFILRETREKLIEKLDYPIEEADEHVGVVRDGAFLAEPQAIPPEETPDPDDAAVLGTASAVAADFLVTGDKLLLAMEKFRGIPIVFPREFWTRVRGLGKGGE